MELLQLLKSTSGEYKLKKTDLPEVEWGLDAGLGAFLYTILDQNRLKSLSADLYERLRASYFSAVFSAEDQFTALEDIVKEGADSAFPVCVLKGMSVSRQYYPRAELRLMRDIDVLVQQADVPKIESALFQQGYKQFSENAPEYYQGHHHTMPFYHDERKVWVEVHIDLFRKGSWRAEIPAFSTENVRREMMASSLDGLEVMRLSPELQVAYIAAHWVEDFKPQGGLFALLDVMFLLNREREFDWDKLLRWTCESRALARPVYLLLDNLRRYQLAEVPADSMAQLRLHCGYGFFLRRFIFNKVLDKYYLQRGVYGKLLNDFTLDVIWENVCRPGRAPYLLAVVWDVVFPRNHAERYHLGWHWRRFKKFLGLSSCRVDGA